MKKLFDSKFLFIVALSTVVLMILGVLAFYLFDDSDDVFVKSGYVINPLSEKSEKYFFDELTSYHENLSSMVVFNDTDNNEVSVFKESFVHYSDDSLSFLKKGAILDLDSIKGTDAVKFYNITNKSIINKKNNEYVIDNNGSEINLKNFIGRISDNKYIVVGNIEAKIPGNEKNISGSYFEVVYMDEGVINIENKDIKFGVLAEGSYIYAGNVVIDLGNKVITKDGEDVMPITAITISGNENIDIIPKAEEKEDNDDNNNNQGNDNNNQPNNNQPDDNGEGTGEGSGGNNTEVVETPGLEVSLKDVSVATTNITVSFDVDNYKDNDNLTLKITNLDTGRTVNRFENIKTNEEIRVNLLSPSTKYLFTVTNELDGSKYFQKIFETNDFGISFEKTYVTSSEIGYKVIIDEGSEINDARLTLKKYNEDTNENEVVGEYQLSSVISMTPGEHDGIIFSDLDSDTIYTAVLDNFSFASTMFNDIYNISLTSLTLKKAPVFGEMKKEVGDSTFKLYLDNVIDTDNAITNYTYNVYEFSNPERPAIDPIVMNSASAVVINIGEGVNELRSSVNYFYKVAIEYFDNEKYVEYVMDGQINLFKGSDPYITIAKDEDKVSHDSIGATINLVDNSCLISMSNRENCNNTSSVQIDIMKKNYSGNEVKVAEFDNVEFDVDGNIIKKDIVVNGLESGVTYVIYVYAIRNDQPDSGMQKIYEPDGPAMITTKSLASFDAKWVNGDSTVTHPIDATVSLKGITGVNSLTGSETADLIKKVVLRLYDGEYSGTLQNQRLLTSREYKNTDDFNIREEFYDKEFEITNDGVFGLSIDDLKEFNKNTDGKLSEYYTLYIEAYYDIGETSAVVITNKQNSYYIDKSLRTDDISEPIIDIVPIKKKNDDLFNESLTNGITVGYTVTASFDRLGFINNEMTPNNIDFYVYNDKGNKVSFYIMNGNNLSLTDRITGSLGNSGSYETNIYMSNGTSYETEDLVMTRGNKYYIGYEISYTDSEGRSGLYPQNTNNLVPVNYGLYSSDVEVVSKDNPKINYLYPTMSTVDNKIIYSYSIIDVDNALYFNNNEYKLYYTVNDGEELGISIVKTNNDVATYSGTFTLDGFSNGDGYTIYEKINSIKSGNIEEDIVNKTIGFDNRLFDGYYNALDSKYNFKFEIINNPLTDNKVTIKILATDDILSRILSYKINFRDTGGNNIDREIWNLDSCSDIEENRCFRVEYTTLKEMKSKTITVSVTAIYDNGLMGIGYNGMVGDGKDYPYAILQENSTTNKIGTYYIINNRTLMKRPDSRYAYGYYLFDMINDNQLTYTSKYNSTNYGTYNIYLRSNGYELASGEFIPKMVSVNNMASDNNTFSFTSITPMIKVENTTSLINGAKIGLNLSGADTLDFCNETSGNNCVTNNNGEKYLYLAVWDNENDIGKLNNTVIPLVKVLLNSDDETINGNYEATVVNLLHGKKYYYNIYTYLNNNGNKNLTQLFDEGYKNKAITYEFNSKKLSDIFDNYLVTYKNSDEGNYNDKIMDVKINLKDYEESLIDFNVKYAFCDYDSDNNIFTSEIDETKLSMVDSQDITEYDLVFDKNYKLYTYVTYKYYDKNTNNVIDVTYPFYEDEDMARVYLKELSSPIFSFSREAKYVDGEYVIDMRVNISDADRVLNNGKYFVKLTNTSGDIVGTLQILDEDNNYVTVGVNGEYLSYELDALVLNRKIRFTGLDSDTKYIATVNGKAVINNYGIDDRNVYVEDTHTIYTTNSSGIAFGREAYYSASENSVSVLFPGGSSFDNVESVDYTIVDYDRSIPIASGSYITAGDDWNNKFQINSNTDEWRFVINPEGLEILLNRTYTVTTAYHYKNLETGNYDIYTLTGPVQYTKNNNN